MLDRSPWRRTLRAPVTFSGIGVHSGAPASVRVKPAQAGAGIAFVRVDGTAPSEPIPAHADFVADARLGTSLRGPDGAEVSTVEHMLAACVGVALDDAVIEMDGPELPILDGAALGYARALSGAGLAEQAMPLQAMEIIAPVAVEDGTKRAALYPRDGVGLGMDVTIRFADPAIGEQHMALDLTPATFLSEIAPARTFGMMEDVERLRASGRGRGASLENAIVVDQGRVVNPEGLRFPDEFVRHKILDAVGDLSLTGSPIIGLFVAEEPGHAINVALVRQLLATPKAWRWRVAA
jgi:UDP-3-O-[3-hydroxymyristoyl] N-acetylglucosamine deacetylase